MKRVWNHNSAYWDDYMGEGNDFVNDLCWPAIEELLSIQSGQLALDIACGNGLTSRRLGRLGARVVAFDVADEMIRLARERSSPEDGDIRYFVLDANDEAGMRRLGNVKFDCALSNMALFDMAEIEPLFRSLYGLLKPGGRFVFSIMHPCFNQAHTALFGREGRPRRRGGLDIRCACKWLHDAHHAKGPRARRAAAAAAILPPTPSYYVGRWTAGRASF